MSLASDTFRPTEMDTMTSIPLLLPRMLIKPSGITHMSGLDATTGKTQDGVAIQKRVSCREKRIALTFDTTPSSTKWISGNDTKCFPLRRREECPREILTIFTPNHINLETGKT